MSVLFYQNSNIMRRVEQPFNKENIIEEIKNQLPEPWIWYTTNDCMGGTDLPTYDLIITRRKSVNEDITLGRAMQPYRSLISTTYSINLGIDVVEDPLYPENMDSDQLVTASIQVKSSRELFNILKKIDCNPGGVKNV